MLLKVECFFVGMSFLFIELIVIKVIAVIYFCISCLFKLLDCIYI